MGYAERRACERQQASFHLCTPRVETRAAALIGRSELCLGSGRSWAGGGASFPTRRGASRILNGAYCVTARCPVCMYVVSVSAVLSCRIRRRHNNSAGRAVLLFSVLFLKGGRRGAASPTVRTRLHGVRQRTPPPLGPLPLCLPARPPAGWRTRNTTRLHRPTRAPKPQQYDTIYTAPDPDPTPTPVLNPRRARTPSRAYVTLFGHAGLRG